MRKLLPIFLALILSITAFAQESPAKTEKPVEIKISGFIMNNLFFDTRKNLDALDGMALLFPLPASDNGIGDDLNEVPNLTLLSFASRLRFSITGPDAFGAKTSGYMEYDFTARANSATVRFRQAWAKLNWEKSELLIGRAWHPLASVDVVPSVMALSVGAPFQPFNRSEQITYTRKMGKWNLILSALYQNDYINNGPAGRSYTYQNNALLPNLHAQLKFKTKEVIAGIGADYKRLKPRTQVVSPATNITTPANAFVNCPAFLAYGQYKKGKLTVSAKSILAANTSESLMAGAFGTVSYDSQTGREEYTPFRHFFAWGNVSYGSKLQVSLFAGYLKNLGTAENILPHSKSKPTVYGMGEDIAQMVRITPTISYTSGKVILGLELENNIADYGTIDSANKGKIINTSTVNGTRLLATMYYNF
jgi:hypothetical protein